MRLNEIEIGTEYAIEDRGMTRKGVALEVGTYEQRVYRGSRDYRGSMTTLKGLKVQRSDYSGNLLFVHRSEELTGEDLFTTKETVTVTTEPSDEPATEWVRPQAVTHTWAVELEGRRARAEREQAKKNVTERINATLAAAGLQFARYYDGKVTLSGSDLTKVLELLEQVEREA